MRTQVVKIPITTLLKQQEEKVDRRVDESINRMIESLKLEMNNNAEKMKLEMNNNAEKMKLEMSNIAEKMNNIAEKMKLEINKNAEKTQVEIEKLRLEFKVELHSSLWKLMLGICGVGGLAIMLSGFISGRYVISISPNPESRGERK